MTDVASRRRPALVVVAVVAVLLAAAALGWALTRDDGDPTAAEAPASSESSESSTSTTDRPAPSSSTTSAPTTTDLPGDPERVPLAGFDEIAVRVLPAGAGPDGWLAWCLLAALDAEQRARGLMGVTDLQGYDGMAFVYDRDVESAFWMRNTPTPLSIAWVAADGRVVSIADMEPCGDSPDCPTYPPGGPYRYAIEVFQGDLPALGITEGATVELGGECAPRTGPD